LQKSAKFTNTCDLQATIGSANSHSYYKQLDNYKKLYFNYKLKLKKTELLKPIIIYSFHKQKYLRIKTGKDGRKTGKFDKNVGVAKHWCSHL
jgi:hypothetical protein